jgi:hypothetical protein
LWVATAERQSRRRALVSVTYHHYRQLLSGDHLHHVLLSWESGEFGNYVGAAMERCCFLITRQVAKRQ